MSYEGFLLDYLVIYTFWGLENVFAIIMFEFAFKKQTLRFIFINIFPLSVKKIIIIIFLHYSYFLIKIQIIGIVWINGTSIEVNVMQQYNNLKKHNKMHNVYICDSLDVQKAFNSLKNREGRRIISYWWQFEASHFFLCVCV